MEERGGGGERERKSRITTGVAGTQQNGIREAITQIKCITKERRSMQTCVGHAKTRQVVTEGCVRGAQHPQLALQAVRRFRSRAMELPQHQDELLRAYRSDVVA